MSLICHSCDINKETPRCLRPLRTKWRQNIEGMKTSILCCYGVSDQSCIFNNWHQANDQNDLLLWWYTSRFVLLPSNYTLAPLLTFSEPNQHLNQTFWMFFLHGRWANDLRSVGLAEFSTCLWFSVMVPYSSCNLPPGDSRDEAGIIEKGKEQRKGTVPLCSPAVSSGRREQPNGEKIMQ